MTESKKKAVNPKTRLVSLLPGHHCGACGEKRCDDFAAKMLAGEGSIEQCVPLRQEQFAENRAALKKLLARGEETGGAVGISGLIDGYEADIELHPLPGEPSCREVLYPFARTELKAATS
jgi:uncharacterized Fe-S cluster-containing protein